jgi:hypothetical protein
MDIKNFLGEGRGEDLREKNERFEISPNIYKEIILKRINKSYQYNLIGLYRNK